MGVLANELPNDILILIFCSLQNDYSSLHHCALVNRAFNHAASKFLYRRVVVAPRFRVVLSLRETPAIPSNCNLISATLPQYAHFVESFEITGYLPLQLSYNVALATTILNSIKAFDNIRAAILTPATFHEEIFTQVLKYLTLSSPPSKCTPPETEMSVGPKHEAPNLRELAVNTSCTDENNASILAQITGLSKLSIHSPTRAILELLPDWLRRLSDSLTELHLKDNCGSVTPGVLKAIVPLLQRNIRSLSLGLSYSITDEDLFLFLRELKELEKVELRFYWQLKPPISRPDLLHLQSFTACHTNFQTRREVQFLCKWIRRAISSSPIQILHIKQDERDDDDDNDIPNNTGANISFRSIIDHICSRHFETIRNLNMKDAYIDVKSLKRLFTTCKELEEISLCAGSHALIIFKKHASSLKKLRIVSFNIKNITLSKRRIIDMELVTSIMKHGPPSLRSLSINGQTWESGWKLTKDSSYALTIHKVPRLVFPWEREQKSSFRLSENLLSTESALKCTVPIVSTPATVGATSAVSSEDRPRVRFIEPR